MKTRRTEQIAATLPKLDTLDCQILCHTDEDLKQREEDDAYVDAMLQKKAATQ